MFLDAVTSGPEHVEGLRRHGLARAGFLPLVAAGVLQGMLVVSVRDDPERLAPTPDLLDRLSGVSAQAGTALQNGRLLDLITFQATHDGLTGLANRTSLTERLGEAVRHARADGGLVGLFYLDLDGFKPVNDELGHGAGDELLTAVGRRLAGSARVEDVPARLGGDEFALLVRVSTSEELDLIGERLRSAFADPFAVRDGLRSIRASIGRAVFPLDAADAEQLLHHADAAMFLDKRRHRASAPAARRPAADAALLA